MMVILREQDTQLHSIIMYIIIIIQTLVNICHASQAYFPNPQLNVVQRVLSQK